MTFMVNTMAWYWRCPLKCFLFFLTVLVVCFPYPTRLVRHIEHWRNPNALIEPDAPALQPLVKELKNEVPADMPPQEALRTVERFVYKKIPYAWDWDTWGTADYLPSVTEVLQMGREDCDGRAVLAASLLQNLGFKAQIVTDFAHVWVRTDKGETMGPGKHKAVEATDHGLRVHWDGLAELPKGLAYGTAVFPLLRELIMIIALWALLFRKKAPWTAQIAGLYALVLGLLAFRGGGRQYGDPVVWLQWCGLIVLLNGVAWTFVIARVQRTQQSDLPAPEVAE